MTIRLFSGTPGSGKTLHAVEEGLRGMRRRGGVIANFPITRARKGRDGVEKWLYVPDEEMTPEFFMERAKAWDDVGKESQALVIVDEAHRILNSRTWDENAKLRLRLLRFLSEHRHFGYDVILVAQADRMLDRQARPLIELETKHFKLNQRWWWLPIPMFLRVEKWYGMPGMKGKLEFVLFPLGKGRYDHMGMRRALRLSAGGLSGSHPQNERSEPLTRREQYRNARRTSEDASQVLDGGAFVPQDLGVAVDVEAAALASADGEVAATPFEGAHDDADLVVGQRDSLQVLSHRGLLRLSSSRWPEGASLNDGWPIHSQAPS
jgi:hypothetical protein